MRKILFITLLFVSFAKNTYSIDVLELQSLCNSGDYLTALSKLDEMNMPDVVKESTFNQGNKFLILTAEVYQNTLSKEKINLLATYYQLRNTEDPAKWNAYTSIQVSAYITNDQFNEAQDICITDLTTKSGRKSKDKNITQFNTLVQLAEIQLRFENNAIAEKLCLTVNTKAEDLFSKSDRALVKSLQRLADLYLLTGDLTKSHTYIEQIEILLKGIKVEDSYDMAALLITQGHLYLKKGEPAVASNNLKKAQQILYSKVPSTHPIYIKHALIYAELAKFMGNYGKGYKHLNDLKLNGELSEDLKFKVELGIIELYYNAEKWQYGLDIVNALTKPALLSTTSPSYYKYCQLKAMASINSKNYQSAINICIPLSDSIKSNLGIDHYLFIESQIQLGNLYYKNGQYKEATKTLKSAIDGLKIYADANHPYYIKIQQELALIYWADGNNKKAKKYFAETSENYIYQYNKVFAILSEKEKNIFYADIRKFYDKFNAFMLEDYKNNPSLISEVYNNQLSNKAILFNSTQELKNSVYSGSDTSLVTKLQTWNGIRENLAKAYKLMAEGIKVDQSLIDNLEKRALELEEYIQLKASINNSKGGLLKSKINWYDVKGYLKSDEAAMEMIRITGFKPDSGGTQTDKIYYAALFLTKKTKKHPELIVFDNGQELETKQNKYYRNLIKFRMVDSISYSKYWKPIMENKKLASIKSLYISPDGIYNQININTLYNSAEDKFVIDKVNISLLTNTKDIVTYRSKTKKRSKLPNNSVLVGFPEYYSSENPNITVASQTNAKIKNHTGSSTRSFRGDAISELPGTKIEIETISGLLSDSVKEHSTVSFLAKDANERNMKNINSPGILHVATHGFFNDPSASKKSESSELEDVYQDNPLLLCGILLSGAGFAYVDEVLQAELKALASGNNMDDGILTAYEAMNMNLDGLELAILSACETGLGKVQNGEGVYGFQRALQTAGAKAILMSLWKVDDEATKKLMIYFYKYWNETGDKMKAFEFAQKKIKDEFKDPIYWGAFIMVGW